MMALAGCSLVAQAVAPCLCQTVARSIKKSPLVAFNRPHRSVSLKPKTTGTALAQSNAEVVVPTKKKL